MGGLSRAYLAFMDRPGKESYRIVKGTGDMDDKLLIDAINFYLRQDERLRRAGLETLGQQLPLAEAILWDYACLAAERLERLRQKAGILIAHAKL